MPNKVHRIPRSRNHHQIPDRSRMPVRTESRIVRDGVISLVIASPLVTDHHAARYSTRPRRCAGKYLAL
jgi:hypothetical protein